MIGLIAVVLFLGGSSRVFVCQQYPEWCSSDNVSDDPSNASPDSNDDIDSLDSITREDELKKLKADVARDCTRVDWVNRLDEIQEFNRFVESVQTSPFGREFLRAFNPLDFPDQSLLNPALHKSIFGYEFDLEIKLVNLQVLGIQDVTILPTNVTGHQSLAFGLFFPENSFEVQAELQLHLTQRTSTGCVEAPEKVHRALAQGQSLPAPARDELIPRSETKNTTCVQACFLSWFPGQQSFDSLDESSRDSFHTALEEQPTCPPRMLPLNVTFGLHDLLLTSEMHLDMMECNVEANAKYGPSICRSTSFEQFMRASMAGPEAMEKYINKVVGKISQMNLTAFEATYAHIDVSRVTFVKTSFLNVFLRFVTTVIRKSINRIKPLHRALQRALTQSGFDNTNNFIDFEYRERFGGSCFH